MRKASRAIIGRIRGITTWPIYAARILLCSAKRDESCVGGRLPGHWKTGFVRRPGSAEIGCRTR